MDSYEAMWVDAATDHVATENLRIYTLAKVAAQQVAWSFLAPAASEAEYQARYELVADRVKTAVAQVSAGDTELLDQVTASLHEDHQLLLSSRVEEEARKLAAEWADAEGPLHTFAATGEKTEGLREEIATVVASTSHPTDRAELARLVTALGWEPNFLVEGAGQTDSLAKTAETFTGPFGAHTNDADAVPHAVRKSYFGGSGPGSWEVVNENDTPIDGLAGGNKAEAWANARNYMLNHSDPGIRQRGQGMAERPPGLMQRVKDIFSTKKAAVLIDPEDIADQYDDPEAFVAGYHDGMWDDNAGLEQHGHTESYRSGQEYGQEAAADQKANPAAWRYEGSKKTADGPMSNMPVGGWPEEPDLAYFVFAEDPETGSPTEGPFAGPFPYSPQGEQQAQQACGPGEIVGEDDETTPLVPRPKPTVDDGAGPGQGALFGKRQHWMHWDGNALYDHHGNKLGHITEVEEGSGWHAAVPAGHTGRLSVVGTHPDREAAKRHVEDEVRKTHAAAKTAEYHYIRENSDGKWEIWQKGTGKTLSTHDSKEQAEAAFRAMESHMHGARWGYLDKEGVFFEVAVNENAFGSERYQHTPVPAKPSWINDEYTDHEVADYGQNDIKNNADGDELKPSAPWLARAEGSLTNSSTVTVPTTWTITAANPFIFDGPGNPASPQSPMSPGGGGPESLNGMGDAPEQMQMPTDTLPDAPNTVSDNSGGLGDPSLAGPTSPDAMNADSMPQMPAPEDDSQSMSQTSARFTHPVDDPVDAIAARVLAHNPGITVRQALVLAQRAVRNNPQLVAA